MGLFSKKQTINDILPVPVPADEMPLVPAPASEAPSAPADEMPPMPQAPVELLAPDLSHFTVGRKGFNQDEVAQYVVHLQQQHSDDIFLVQQRLIEAQQQTREEHAKAERQVSQINTELERVRTDLTGARAFGGVDPEREAELVLALGQVAELEVQLALAEQSDQPAPVELRKLEIRLEEAQRHAQDSESKLYRAEQAAESASERASKSLVRISELEAELQRISEMTERQDQMSEDLRKAELKLRRQGQLNETLRAELDGSGKGQMLVQLEEQAAKLEKRSNKIEKLSAEVAELQALGSAEQVERLGGQLKALQFERDDLRESLQKAEQTVAMAGDAPSELRHLRSDLERVESERTEVRLEMAVVRTRMEDALQDTARAATRIEILESELKENREHREEFGDQARRMMQALNESRDQQEREMERELGTAREEADEVRSRASRDAEQMHMSALEQSAELEEAHQRLTDEALSRSRQITGQLQGQVDDLVASADHQVESVRIIEDKMRIAVRQAQEVDLWQKQQERDILTNEIGKLALERDALMFELTEIRAEMKGDPPPAVPRPPMPPAEPPVALEADYEAAYEAPFEAPGQPTAAYQTPVQPADQEMLIDYDAAPAPSPVDLAGLAQTPNPTPDFIDPASMPASMPPQPIGGQVAPPAPPAAPAALPVFDPNQAPVVPAPAPQVFDEGE